MKILSEELLKDDENTKEFINNMKSSIKLNIDIQNKYKMFLFNYTTQLVDLKTDDFNEKDNDVLINLLYELQKVFPTINELLVKLGSIKSKINKLELPYNLDDINSLFLEYMNLQDKIVLENSKLLDFFNSASKFIVFNFLPTNVEGEDILEPETTSNKNEENTLNSTLNSIELLRKNIEKTSEQAVSANSNGNHFEENTLVISDIKQVVVLPYTLNELDNILKTKTEYANYDEIIQNLYTIPYLNYKNSVIARFKEAFKLVRNKEHKSVKAALDLGLELLFNYNLHPAIISACKTTDELDIYLDYLETNETDKFDIFNIKYEMLPTIH